MGGTCSSAAVRLLHHDHCAPRTRSSSALFFRSRQHCPHPDRGGSKDEFQKVSIAYTVLKKKLKEQEQEEQKLKEEEERRLLEEEQRPKEEGKRLNGKVKWFNGAKGYGFIEREGEEKNVFVHFSAVKKSGLKSLKEGEQLTFEIENTDKGPSAINLRKTS